ncbi:hypothetical protein PENTCL1PPCAC_8152, partial [Pristionchus entomophagus]
EKMHGINGYLTVVLEDVTRTLEKVAGNNPSVDYEKRKMIGDGASDDGEVFIEERGRRIVIGRDLEGL